MSRGGSGRSSLSKRTRIGRSKPRNPRKGTQGDKFCVGPLARILCGICAGLQAYRRSVSAFLVMRAALAREVSGFRTRHPTPDTRHVIRTKHSPFLYACTDTKFGHLTAEQGKLESCAETRRRIGGRSSACLLPYRRSLEKVECPHACSVLGCRHLLSTARAGIEIQTYCAIIACLLMALWTGGKPTLRTYEMVCLYLQGWADEDELHAHLEKLKPNVA